MFFFFQSNALWSKFLSETYRDPKLRDLKVLSFFRLFFFLSFAHSPARQLDTYLIKPIQRVCRYPLLLGELQRATADGHPDKDELLAASKI